MRQALRGRLALASSMGGVTLARLCGVDGARVYDKNDVPLQRAMFAKHVNPATAAALFAPLDLATFEYDGSVDKLSAVSRGIKANVNAFLAELDALEVGEESHVRPVRIIKPSVGETWDLCVKVLDPNTGKAFHIFYDMKSSAEFSEAQRSIGATSFVENPEQYVLTKAVLGPSRPFLYVYLSTYVEVTSQVLSAAAPAEAALPSRCLVLSRYDTLTLLGPFAEIYQTARAALGAKKAGVAEQSNKAPEVVSGEGSNVSASKRPKGKSGSRKKV